jgi:hypothetical protein
VADEQKGSEEKSLEMRVSELEDKLAQVHVTEDEMRAFQKVSQLMGGAAATPSAPGGGVAAGCVVDCNIVNSCLNECLIRPCTIVRQCTIIRQCGIVRQCTVLQCFECGGGCAPGGMIGGGGGFGGLGG